MDVFEMALIIFAIITLFVATFVITIYAKNKFYNAVDKRIERFQSELIEKQVNEIQNMYKQVRGWRHDYRNHIQNMQIQLRDENYFELSNYLTELAGDLEMVDTVIKTGNVMADAILNSKLTVAEKLNIKCNVKVNIPQNIPLSDIELCSILGNLLDNATEACSKIPENLRYLRLYISTFKNQLYLSVQNSSPAVNKSKNLYISTKRGEHGFGIFRIDRIAKKYNGFVNRQNEQGVFATELMIPLTYSV